MKREIHIEADISQLEKWWLKELDSHKGKELLPDELARLYLRKEMRLSKCQIEKATMRYNHERQMIQITCPE
jgi:hypothetical protein